MQVDLDALDLLYNEGECNPQVFVSRAVFIWNAYPAIAAELREARREVLRLQQVYAASVQEVAAKSRELHEASRRIANQRKELGGFAMRVRKLEAEIEVRDESANETLRILREALPNRGFHSEMEAAEAARHEIAELREYREKEAERRAKADCYDRICQHIGVERDVIGTLDARDRRMKAIGAAEEVELLIGNWRNMRLEDYLPRRAAQLRQEAGE